MKATRLDPWTPEDDERLRKLAREGRTVLTIAERLKRPTAAVRYRAKRLGVELMKAKEKT
jgi:hypothetical protein